ncbi:MAG: hypothetical protein JWQ52_899 [Phenylobacterium sp.]|jgi:hypothetical protein|nr:hypothetical protein [Phenylobacterium sp.]
MANWDNNRGSRGSGERDPSGRDDRREPGGRGGERRSFGDEGRFNSDQARYGVRGGRGEGEREPWRRDRYGSRFDQDHVDYGSGYDRDRGGYGRGYGGQEYGMEGRGGPDPDRDRRYGSDEERETWRPAGGAPYGDLEMNPRNRGVQEYGQPADYAAHPQAGHEFDPDYLRWRDEQMKGHDRDYQDWRRAQHQQYDDDYRRFRAERRDHFHQTFHAWRSQRNISGGVPDTSISPGDSGYSDSTSNANPLGFSDRPSGMIEPRSALTGSPAMTQTGVSHQPDSPQTAGQAGDQGGAGDTSPEFGKEPPQVRAATDGDTRGGDEDRAERKDEQRDESRH